MDWTKAHVGQHRQGAMAPAEIEAEEKAGMVPGINPDLHAPVIELPGETVETNLHGDVEGSPYSRTPGEMSLAEAADKDKAAAGQPAADAGATRQREWESRRTGTPTETLAAEDEGDEKPAPKRSAKK